MLGEKRERTLIGAVRAGGILTLVFPTWIEQLAPEAAAARTSKRIGRISAVRARWSWPVIGSRCADLFRARSRCRMPMTRSAPFDRLNRLEPLTRRCDRGCGGHSRRLPVLEFADPFL